MPGGGGGADLDVITAGAGDVVAPKVIVNKDGEPLAGTLPDKNDTAQAAAASLDTTNKRLQMAVPVLGRYNTGSKLYTAYSAITSLIGLTAAKLMKGQSVLGIDGMATGDATAAAGDILSGKTAYVNGNKIPGSMATLAGGTYTPGTSPQTIACSGKKMTSNIVIAAIPSGVSTSFISAGGRMDYSTYSGQNTDYDTIYPHGNITPSRPFSEIKSKCASGLTLPTTAYVYDRYLNGSTSYYWKEDCNFMTKPILLAPVNRINVKFKQSFKRQGNRSSHYLQLRVYTYYWNDGSTAPLHSVRNYTTSDDNQTTSVQNYTNDITITIDPSLKNTYKWVAVVAQLYIYIDNSGSQTVTLYAGTGITDVSWSA